MKNAGQTENLEPMTLGAYIRKARKAKEMSLRELARRVKVVPQYLSDIERDRDSASEKVLERIAVVLELNPEFLQDLNPALQISDLRDILAYNRDLGIAFAKLVRGLKAGTISPEEVLAALPVGGSKNKKIVKP